MAHDRLNNAPIRAFLSIVSLLYADPLSVDAIATEPSGVIMGNDHDRRNFHPSRHDNLRR